MPTKTRQTRLEFGDFQTPLNLASTVVQHIHDLGFRPRSVLEPTCGKGSFLIAALQQFSELEQAVGFDLNPNYLSELRKATAGDKRVKIQKANCFSINWKKLIASLPQPLLILGNPPWVTSSRLGLLQSENSPARQSSSVKNGLDAVTGKSNFDVSEWLLQQWIEAMSGMDAWLVMLVKSSVARRVMLTLANGELGATTFPIDAAKHFGATVTASILDVHAGGPKLATHNGLLISNRTLFDRRKNLAATEFVSWRSGIKHDAAKVLELIPLGEGNYRNGLGAVVQLESNYLYPLLKSTDLARAQVSQPARVLLVPQVHTGALTSPIERNAPLTWAYLQSHGHLLDARASSVYLRAPRFAIFGVGEYSFAPWKVATSCLHKKLQFHAIGPFNGKPVVFDDVSAFLSFRNQQEALQAADLLNSIPAREFLESLVFWDAKRPLTIELLRTLSFQKLQQSKEEAT